MRKAVMIELMVVLAVFVMRSRVCGVCEYEFSHDE